MVAVQLEDYRGLPASTLSRTANGKLAARAMSEVARAEVRALSFQESC